MNLDWTVESYLFVVVLLLFLAHYMHRCQVYRKRIQNINAVLHVLISMAYSFTASKVHHVHETTVHLSPGLRNLIGSINEQHKWGTKTEKKRMGDLQREENDLTLMTSEEIAIWSNFGWYKCQVWTQRLPLTTTKKIGNWLLLKMPQSSFPMDLEPLFATPAHDTWSKHCLLGYRA